MSNYKRQFIDADYFINVYNTAFIAEFNELTEEEQNRFFSLGSTRIKKLADRPFVDLNDLEIEQGEGVQVATAILVDY